MKNKFLSIICLAFFLSGLNGCSTQVCGCIEKPNEIAMISYIDEQGQDLLDPDYENSINKNNLEFYYVEDGEKSREPGSADIIYEEETKNYILQLHLSSHIEENGFTTTFIEFANGTDTLKLEPRGEDGAFGEKFWYNGDLVWEVSSEEPIYLEITKTSE